MKHLDQRPTSGDLTKSQNTMFEKSNESMVTIQLKTVFKRRNSSSKLAGEMNITLQLILHHLDIILQHYLFLNCSANYVFLSVCNDFELRLCYTVKSSNFCVKLFVNYCRVGAMVGGAIGLLLLLLVTPLAILFHIRYAVNKSNKKITCTNYCLCRIWIMSNTHNSISI